MEYDSVICQINSLCELDIEVEADGEQDLLRKLDEFYIKLETEIGEQIDGIGECWLANPRYAVGGTNRSNGRHIVELSINLGFMFDAPDAASAFDATESVFMAIERGQMRIDTPSVDVVKFTDNYVFVKTVEGDERGWSSKGTMTIPRFIAERRLKPSSAWNKRIKKFLDRNYVEFDDTLMPEYSESMLADAAEEAIEEYGD